MDIMFKPNKSQLQLLLLASSLAIFLFMAGCTDPNENLTFSRCCDHSDDVYTCTAQVDPDTGQIIYDTNGISQLIGCGPCTHISRDGKVYAGSVAPANEIEPTLCENNCNFLMADCSDDENNTCFWVNGSSVTNLSVGSLCAKAIADPCIKNRCTAMMCGEEVPDTQPTMDSGSLNSLSGSDENKQNSYKKEAESGSNKGLIGKVCRLEPLNKKNSRLLTSKNWFVNTLRLGVQGSFSDYDRLRYYLPPTDFYCTSNNPNAVVDRFTAYLNGTRALDVFRGSAGIGLVCLDNVLSLDPEDYYGRWDCPLNGNYYPYNCPKRSDGDLEYERCVFGAMGSDKGDAKDNCNSACISGGSGNNFKAPLDYCEEVQEEVSPGVFEIKSYRCAMDPAIEYSVSQMGSPTAAYTACTKDCSFKKFKDCTDNQELLIYNNTISPNLVPYSSLIQKEVEPYTDIFRYAELLKEAYPSLPPPGPHDSPILCNDSNDPQNYYKCQLPVPTESASQQEKDKFLQEMMKQGPAGAKVFECSSNDDCLSGQCDKSAYFRGVCFHNETGAVIDCDCKMVSLCQMAFNCNSFSPGGPRQAICQANYESCKRAMGGQDSQNGDVVIACGYDHNDTKLYVGKYKVDGDRGADDDYNNVDEIRYYTFMDFACYKNNYTNINSPEYVPALEMATTMGYVSDAHICEYPNGDTSSYLCNNDLEERNCVSGTNKKKVGDYWIGNKCGEDLDWEGESSLRRHESKDAIEPRMMCPTGATLNSTAKGFMDYEYELWRRIFIFHYWRNVGMPVPSVQSVAGPFGPNLLQTSGQVEWCDDDPTLSLSGLRGQCNFDDSTGKYSCTCGDPHPWEEVKFKFARGCELEYGEDIELVDPNAYADNPSGAPGAFYYGFPTDKGKNDPNLAQGIAFMDRTWKLKGYGVCMFDEKNRPQVTEYGFCKPCGSMLSLAYQEVKNLSTNYCPEGCRLSLKHIDFYNFQWVCNCDEGKYPQKNFILNRPTGPIVYPRYDHITDKIIEYQGAGIIPILDIRDYVLDPPDNPSYLCLDGDESCSLYDAVEVGTGSPCSIWDRKCQVLSYPDWFLEFLRSNHSATILLAGDLEQDCSSNGPDCDDLVQRLTELSATHCPKCMKAIEYPPLLKTQDILNAQDQYPQELNDRITGLSNDAAEFNATNYDGPSTWVAGPDPPHMQMFDFVVLNIDLSNADLSNLTQLEEDLKGVSNISRRILQHIGKSTIWKLNYDRSTGGPGALVDENLYYTLYKITDELALKGVSGILLPPFDNADPDGSEINSDDPARMLALPPGSVSAQVNMPGTPFCAAQRGSTEFLHPEVIAGVQKVYTKENCSCVPCQGIEVATGQCKKDELCMDGRSCTQPNPPITGNYKCEGYCVYNNTCKLCNGTALAGKMTTCTAIRSTNRPAVVCCKGDPATDPPDCQDWPDCDRWEDITLEEMANTTLHPDSAYLIAGLPKEQSCCIQEGSATYTYRSSASVSMSSQPVMYPNYGSNETDCGQMSAPDPDNPATCGAPLPPITNTMWSCLAPY